MNVMNRSFRQFGLLTTTVILVICVALITGSTFSLFTSGTDEDINIGAAQVKVSSVIKDLKTYSMGQDNGGSTFANGGEATIIAEDPENGTKSGITLSRLTPGDRAEFTIDVINYSNVNIAYQLWFEQVINEFVNESLDENWLSITVTNQNNEKVDLTGDKTDYIYADPAANTVTGERIESFNVAIELDFNTPNEYQNKIAKVEFKLDAVQANVVTVKVANAAHLKYALEHFGKAVLVGDIELNEIINIPSNQEITLNLNGHRIDTYTENGVAIDSYGELTVVDEPIDEVALVASTDEVGGMINGVVVNRGELEVLGGTIATIINANNAKATINADVTTLTNDGTATIAGGNFTTVENNSAMTINAATVATIDNEGTIAVTNATVATIDNAGTATIKAANVTSVNNTNSMVIENTDVAETIANEGTVTVTNVTANAITNEGDMDINSATVDTIENSNGGQLTITTANVDNIINIDESEVEILFGGTYGCDVSDYLQDEYTTIPDEEGNNVVVKREVISIGSVKYGSLREAVEAAGKNAVLTLLDDVTVKSMVTIPSTKAITIDLNGKSLSIAEEIVDTDYIISNLGTLTIKDSVGGGAFNSEFAVEADTTMTINGGTFDNGFTVKAGATMTINGGAFDNGFTVEADAAMTINGGTFDSEFTVKAGATMTINGGAFDNGFTVEADAAMTINGGTFTDDGENTYTINGNLAVQGGTYTGAAIALTTDEYVKLPYETFEYEEGTVAKVLKQLAKIGDTIYYDIDEAIAAWTNGKTLTLVADVTLNDTVVFKSTEHHILNLSTYTLTAASDKNAFEIVAYGTGDAERTAITITADANNPGSIDAGKKAVIYYNYSNGTTTGNDRPIIKIEGGVFYGSTNSFGNIAGIYVKGAAARQCATINISGGTFNCSINGVTKSKLLISGGTFNYSVGSQGDSTALRLISGGRFKTIGFMTADSNNTKFWIGTAMATSNVGVYIDDEGYIVIGGAVITEAGDRFVASASYSTGSSYLQYSSAKDNGLYYTSLQMAFSKSKNNVTVYVDTIDMTTLSYNGTINSTADTLTVTFAEGTTPTWTVTIGGAASTYTDVVVDGIVTRTYTAQ